MLAVGCTDRICLVSAGPDSTRKSHSGINIPSLGGERINLPAASSAR